jgi:uncharacterized repeat protein (TIGR01451 family)
LVTKCALLAALPLYLAIMNAQPAVVINEYPVAGPDAGAGPIASGSDGALWFPGGHLGFPGPYQIFRITTSGVVTSYSPQGPTNIGGVGGITTGPDGNLWYTGGNNQIWQLTTSGVFTSFPLINADSSPGAIASGPDGALWFTEPIVNANHGSAIGRITTSGVFTQYLLPTASAEPTAIAAGSDGALWFTEYSSDKIGRITTSGTTINEYPVPTPSTLTAIAAGPDGALWFTESSAGKLGRITTAGVVTEYPVPMGVLQSIAAGPDGAMWFAAGPYIGRITTVGVVTEYPVPTGGFSAVAITAGPDGAMWFTASNGSLAFEIGQAVINPNPVPAILSITKTHTGNFGPAQTNATYTVTVSNQPAASPTSGLVTVTDTLPSGLSLVSMAGLGWNCTGNSCTRSDPLMGGASYPPITVTVDVTANAGTPVVNVASVSGGGSATSSAQDSTTIADPPLLSITKTHTGSFAQGQMNAVYTLTVSNGAGPTSGTVTVTEMPPAGLTLVSMAGSGWTCGGAACTRSDVLTGNSSYPAITVMVNVAANAGSPQVNQASVSGGGAVLTAGIADSTVITGSQPPSFFAGEVSLGSGVDYLTFPDNTLFGYYEHLAGSFIYHFDMGFEYVFPANDASGDVYFWDDQTGHWWYTGPTLFPNLYDFTLGAWIFYFADPANPGHYTTNPRKFASDATHVTFTM